MNELKFAEWLALEGWLCPVQQQTPSVWTRGNEWKTIEELSNIFSKKKTIVVWFSCGAASAVAAKKTIEKYGSTHNVVVVNTPIYNEHPDNQRFLKDVEKLKQQGLIKGGSLDNAIVVDEDKVLNDNGLRYKDEFVRHKVLDSIGDLYLSGSRIMGHFEGVRSGHSLNNKLLRALFADSSAWRMMQFNDKFEFPNYS